MGRTISAKEMLSKTYEVYEIAPEWQAVLGLPERNFRMLIWGPSGSGKTTFAMLLAKELSKLGKVYYNSIEQGEDKTLQDCLKLTQMQEVPASVFSIGDRDTYEEMMLKLKTNKARFVVIDSCQYLNLTTEQYKRMIKTYPKKAFIIVSWEQNGNPKGEYAKAIRYMVDIKCHVLNGLARCQSRFGATVPYRIFGADAEQKVTVQLKLI
jgi:thymidine kinase